jgi:hypothetical protein
MKEFESVDGKSFGFVERIVTINGTDWAYVIAFSLSGKRKNMVKLSSIKVLD